MPRLVPRVRRPDVGRPARRTTQYRGDDPTHNELEAFAASLTGKEAAIFLPSGTMANLSALLTHVRPGEEVIVETRAHIYNSELGGLSAVAGAVPRPVEGKGGILQPADVERAIRHGGIQSGSSIGLICLENTLNAAGGIVLPTEISAGIWRIAEAARLPVHLDGARLFNAAAYLGTSVAELCRHCDTVMFSLSKGLGAPMGSVLAGEADFIARARKKARMLGGGMRQSGLMAAAALAALRNPMPRLERDHAMARLLAEGLRRIEESLIRAPVQTNIVNCHIDRFLPTADAFVAGLRDDRVLANFAGAKVRFVTHQHIDEAAVLACIKSVERLLASMRCPA